MANNKKNSVGRRGFLKGAAAGAAASLVTKPQSAQAQENPTRRPVVPPTTEAVAAETQPPSKLEVQTTDRPGADFMVDVIKSLGIEYVFSNPGSSFRGIHESIINYGGNHNPEFITCCHEESSVAMAQGYFKIEGKPILALCHGTVGLQHASMAIYNAYCDRVPVYVMFGNIMDAAWRRGSYEWLHSVQDAAAIVRDFTKWDDTPMSLTHFAESAVRAYKVAMTPPYGPVLIAADAQLQELPVPDLAKLHIPKLTLATPPQGDSNAVNEAARMLVAAENPVIVTNRMARTSNGIQLLVELAETLQAAVVDQRMRLNFPSAHPLNQSRTRVIPDADVILGLEVGDFYHVANSYSKQMQYSTQRIVKRDAKLISIAATELYLKSNYQDFQRFQELDLAIAADAEATLPSLIEAVKRQITPDRKRAFEARGVKLAEAHRKADEQARIDASYAWDASPISTARLSAEIWAQIKNEDWSLVAGGSVSDWPDRLWKFDKHHQYLGLSGGGGVGYAAPSSVGAALANKKYGRLSVSIQNDGDLMYGPSVLWTAAHHRIPLLSIMHNNRAYHAEVMLLQAMANQHNRGITRTHIGTRLSDPNVDFAKMAQGFGLYGAGPITNPNDLAPAIRRGIEAVKRGEPALIDVVTQPR